MMDIPYWLIGLVVLAIIAVFLRQQGEIRLDQRPGSTDTGDGTPYPPAATEAQPPVMMSEDQQNLKELTDARNNVQEQLDFLVTRRSGGGPAADRLRAVLKEIDEQIAELRSERA
jgi:hypothetical protein